jgi:hypothetical protein
MTTITYATNNPENGYELMISGEVPEKYDFSLYTPVWVYDPSSFNDDAPDWTRFPMDHMIHTPITTTEGAQAFLRYMADTGRSFHPDDDPSTIVNVSTGELTFAPNEWEPLRDRIGEVFSHMADPYTFIMDLEDIL